MHLLLIRHGETDWNVEARAQGFTDTLLNARGIEQAERLAERMASEPPSAALYTSPLARARVTAEIIGKKCGVTPILDDRLKEQGLGELEGMTGTEYQLRSPEIFAAWRANPLRSLIPGQEKRDEFQQRLQSFLDDIRARHAEDTRVTVVTHGGAMGMMLAILMELDISQRFPFWFDNASVSMVDLGARFRIRLLNDTCHLNGNCK